jgi:hypothetical protein
MIYGKPGIRVLLQHELTPSEYKLANFWVRVAVYAKDLSRRMLAVGEDPSNRPDPPSPDPVSVKFVGCDYYHLARHQAREERKPENGGMENQHYRVSVMVFNQHGERMGNQVTMETFLPATKFHLDHAAYNATHRWATSQTKDLV